MRKTLKFWLLWLLVIMLSVGMSYWLTITNSFDNAVQYIKTILLTSNGNNSWVLWVKLDWVNSQVWSSQYCDQAGTWCFGSNNVASGVAAFARWDHKLMWYLTGAAMSWYVTWYINDLARTTLTCSTNQVPSYSGGQWTCMSIVIPSWWSLLGNANINSGINFIGTTDNNPLIFKTNGQERMVMTPNGYIWIWPSQPWQKLHIGDGNVLIEWWWETAMQFKRDAIFTGVHPQAPFNNPIFQIGRIIQWGDGAPQFRWMYGDDSDPEHVVFELDSEGILSSVRRLGTRWSHFEAHSILDKNPYFRLNSYPYMQLQMGNGWDDDTDVSVGRSAANTISFVTSGTERTKITNSGITTVWFTMSTWAVSGYVLTSDGSWVARWMPAPVWWSWSSAVAWTGPSVPYYIMDNTTTSTTIARDYNQQISKWVWVYMWDGWWTISNAPSSDRFSTSFVGVYNPADSFGQLTVTDNNAYFRWWSISGIAGSVWKKLPSVPAANSFVMTAGSNTVDSDVYLSMPGNHSMIFRTNDTDRVIIREWGKVWIGTNTPDTKLHIRAWATDNPKWLLKLDYNDALFNPGEWVLQIQWVPQQNPNIVLWTTDGDAHSYVKFLDESGSMIGSISRATSASNIAFNTTSDSRLKTNVAKTSIGLRELMSINIYDYIFKGDITKTRLVWVMAQELYKIFPSAVKVWWEDPEKDPWQVDYSKMVPLLISSIQEQQKQIDTLQKQVQILQKQINTK